MVGMFAGMLYGGSKEASASVVSFYFFKMSFSCFFTSFCFSIFQKWNLDIELKFSFIQVIECKG